MRENLVFIERMNFVENQEKFLQVNEVVKNSPVPKLSCLTYTNLKLCRDEFYVILFYICLILTSNISDFLTLHVKRSLSNILNFIN